MDENLYFIQDDTPGDIDMESPEVKKILKELDEKSEEILEKHGLNRCLNG